LADLSRRLDFLEADTRELRNETRKTGQKIEALSRQIKEMNSQLFILEIERELKVTPKKRLASFNYRYSIAAYSCVAINLFCLYRDIALEDIAMVNIPLRGYMLFQSFKNKEYLTPLLNISSYVALFFEEYRILSVAVDLFCEVIRVDGAYRAYRFENKKIKPLHQHAALTVFYK
ncbi:MAG: hypothetical protein AAGE99_03035, partial [Chlamydiota bacterium]